MNILSETIAAALNTQKIKYIHIMLWEKSLHQIDK